MAVPAWQVPFQVWVPTPEHEALRDFVRQRAAAKSDESRAKHRLVKHLLRRGLREPDESGAWTHPWWRWVQSLKLEHEAQQVALADCIAEVLHMGERFAVQRRGRRCGDAAIIHDVPAATTSVCNGCNGCNGFMG